MADIPPTIPTILTGIGTLLVVAEAVMPGAHFMVIGLALLGAGITGLVIGTNSFLYLGIFALFYGGITYYYYRNNLYPDEEVARTSSSSDLQGKVGRVVEEVTNDTGRIKIDEHFDPSFAARNFSGETIEVGEKVRVVDPRGGNVLVVERFEEISESDNEISESDEEISESDEEI
ncbi:MAG: NfeD family protein [Halobacteria archaeon]